MIVKAVSYDAASFYAKYGFKTINQQENSIPGRFYPKWN